MMVKVKKKNRYSHLLIFLALSSGALSIVISVLKYQVLPARFFFDAGMIKRFMEESTSFDLFSSYSTTALFYKFLPGGDSVLLVSIFSTLVCIFVAWQAVNSAGRIKRPDIILIALIFTYLSLSSIFLAQHSKDFLVLLVVSSYLALTKYKVKGVICFIAIATVYAILFRPYWLIVISFFAASLFFQSKKFSFKKLSISCFSMLLTLALLFEIALGVPLNHYRSIVNDVRINAYDANAQTIITSFLPTGNFILEWLNALITWVFLMFPVPLLTLFSVYHMASFILIAFLFIVFFSLRGIAASSQSAKISFIFIFCFTLVQSIFEPDYGSFLRHFTPLLPVLIYLYALKLKASTIDNP